MSGLGYPPINYTQNANEALNSAFKYSLEKKLTLSECVSRVQLFVKRQQGQVLLAVISCSDYNVLPQYEFLKITEERYYRMAEKSKAGLN